MIWYTLSILLIITACGFLLACSLLRRKAYKLEQDALTAPENTQKVMYKKSKLYLTVGVACLILAECFILVGNHIE